MQRACRLTAIAGSVIAVTLAEWEPPSSEARAAAELGGRSGAPRCLGRPATYVGTPGSDKILSRSPHLDGNPVLVLLGGVDRVSIDPNGTQARVCMGPGDDHMRLRGSGDKAVADSFFADGGPGADQLRYSDGHISPITLRGAGGNDVLAGGNSADTLIGGRGGDSVFAGGGMDNVFGGAGKDYLSGNEDNDTLHGEQGDDFLDGEGPSGPGARDRGKGGAGSDECDEVEIRKSCSGG